MRGYLSEMSLLTGSGRILAKAPSPKKEEEDEDEDEEDFKPFLEEADEPEELRGAST